MQWTAVPVVGNGRRRGNMRPIAGMPLTGFITLADKLGEGGMGSVWAARHAGLGTKVAVKLIARDAPHEHPTLVPRFEREAVVTDDLMSPHAVRNIEHGVAKDGTPYIVMELLDGESLEARLERVGQLSLQETERIVAQVAEVLSEAHALGITHRDIKPGNIFLLPGDEIFVKVLDFGIAKLADAGALALTANDSFLGSPHYMSPEQITGAAQVDGRADLWSLAVVAYEALTGKPAFMGDTLGQIMMAVVNREYSTPLSARAELPSTLYDFFGKAFAYELDGRFQRGDELAGAFTAAATGRSITPQQPNDDELGKTIICQPESQQADGFQPESQQLERFQPDTFAPPSIPIDPPPMERTSGWLPAAAVALVAVLAIGMVAFDGDAPSAGHQELEVATTGLVPAELPASVAAAVRASRSGEPATHELRE